MNTRSSAQDMPCQICYLNYPNSVSTSQQNRFHSLGLIHSTAAVPITYRRPQVCLPKVPRIETSVVLFDFCATPRISSTNIAANSIWACLKEYHLVERFKWVLLIFQQCKSFFATGMLLHCWRCAVVFGIILTSTFCQTLIAVQNCASAGRKDFE